jgi:hypothetical protein
MVAVRYIRVLTSLRAKGLELRNIYSDNGVLRTEIDSKGIQDMREALEGVNRVICLTKNRL